MPIIVVGTEKNFTALRPVLFEGRVSTAVVGEAKEAIREANPHADLDKLEPGTVLTVPENLPGVAVQPQPSLSVSSAEPVGGLSARGKGQLDALAQAAKGRDAAAKAERKQLDKAFASKALEAAMKRDKKLAADIEAARNAMADEEAREKERAAELKKAQAEWAAGLESMEQLARQLPNVSVVATPARSSRGSRA